MTATFDLHVHSQFSYDSFQRPSWILKAADWRGLDAVAVTDHDSFVGSERALEIADEYEVTVVGGMEVRTDEYGDLLALFIDRAIQSRGFDEVLREIREQNGLAVLPHPYRKYDEVPEWVVDRVDGIEGRNARSRGRDNERATRLTGGLDIPVLGGSDAHTPWEVGTVHTTASAPVESRAELREALESGAVEPAGSGLPYYLTHGTSYGTEQVKRRVTRDERFLGGL